jgi:uncharacterized protein (TIGR00251 family)
MTAGRPAAGQDGPDVLLAIRVQPRSARTEIVFRSPQDVTLRLSAPPVEGKANLACCRFLADLLDLPQSRITIARGGTARRKIVRIAGADAASVMARLESAARRG